MRSLERARPRPLVAAALVVPLALALSAVPAAAQNLATNGSFEIGPDPGMSTPVLVGSEEISGWVVIGNPVDYVGTQWNAAHGARSVALNGTNPGGIAQTIPTIPGILYSVRFFMAGDAFSSPILKHMRVSAAGQSQDYEFDAGHSWPWGMGWLEQAFDFTAAAGTTTIEFTSLDAGDTGPTLDSVVVVSPALLDATDPLGLSYALATPSPNPAHRVMTVSYTVPTRSRVRVSVHDVRGREIEVIANSVHEAGPYVRTWDATARRGRVAPGLYLIRLSAPGMTLVRKAALIP